MPGFRVGVGNGDRALGDLDCLEGGAVSRMRHVDYQPDPVHLLDDLSPHAGDAGVGRLVAPGREEALVIVRELHEADTEHMTYLDEADIVLDRRGVLQSKKDRGAILAPRAMDVGSARAVEDQLRET